MRKTILAVVVVPALLLGVGLLLYGPVVSAKAFEAMDRMGTRLGLDIDAARVVTLGFGRVAVEDLRVGPRSQPLATAERVVVQLNTDRLKAREIEITEIVLEGAILHMRGDGSVEGALRALRRALPRRPQSTGAGPRRRLPRLVMTGGRVVDHGGAIAMSALDVTFDGGHIDGAVNVLTPPIGRCRFVGDTAGLELSCEQAINHALPGGLRIVASAAVVSRRPTLEVRIPKVQILSDRAEGRLARLLGGVSADLTVGLQSGEAGYPLQASLVFPNGGRISGSGHVDRARLALGGEFTAMPLDQISHRVTGMVSGRVALEVSLPNRTLSMNGEVELKGLTITDAALSETRVGPMDVGLSGQISAVSPPDGPLRAIRLEVTDGVVRLGELEAKVSAIIDTTGAAPKGELHVDAGRKLSAKKVLAAIPRGLFPHLRPMRVRGFIGMRGDLKIDLADVKATTLDVKLNVRRLKIDSINDRLDFEALRDRFDTHFEMPEGEILSRTTGPRSERWTPLELIPPLMPEAVVAQEDGGFYRHKGISLFHLRGSLIRNLERGRFARGGSTLTMQLARNLFLTRKKNLARKLEEVVLAWMLEKAFSKDELITLYLNVVEFGPDVFGLGEASQYYFGRLPEALTPTQIAFLVRLLPGPRLFHRQFEKRKLRRSYARRMKRLLKRLVDRGHLTEAAYEASLPIELWVEPPPEVGDIFEDRPVPPAPAPPSDIWSP